MNVQTRGCPQILAGLLVASLLAGCTGPAAAPDEAAPKRVEDPLRNTRKLVTEGHRTLYDNGAFEIPFTTLKLIPPGPRAEDVLFEQAGRNARQSFLLSVEGAEQAVQVVADGTRYSYELATEIHRDTADVVTAIQAHMRPGSKLIAHKSYLAGKGIRGATWESAHGAEREVAGFGAATAEVLSDVGGRSAAAGGGWILASPEVAMAIIAAGSRGGDAAELALDAGAERMATAIDRQGDTLRLAGAARLLTSPETVRQAHGAAAETAGRTDESARGAGRSLAESGRRTGDSLTDSGAAVVGMAPGMVAGPYAAAAAAADRLGESSREAVPRLRESTGASGRSLAALGTESGLETQRSGSAAAGRAYDEGTAAAGTTLREGGQAFVLGYAALPAKLGQRVDEVEASGTLDALAERVSEHTDWLSEKSDYFLGVIRESIDGYGDAVKLKLERAGQEFDSGLETFGVSLAMLKALRWVVEGLVWDGAVRPAGAVTGAALGYLAVGGVAYPAMVTYEAGKSTAYLAVQVTRSTALGAYDIVAPTGQAALAGLLAAAQWSAGAGTAVAVGGGTAVAGAGQMAGGQIAGAGVKGLGVTLGAATEYVAVPLAQAGLHVGGGVAGVVAGTTTLAAGTGIMAAGQVVKGTAVGTGAALEHLGAPLAAAAVQTAGTTGGVAQGVFDEVSGVTLYATGGMLAGTAKATEWAIKYGVAPATDLAVTGTGAVAGAGAGAAQATAGGVVYVWGQVVRAGGWVGGKFVEHAAAPVTMAGIAGVGVTTSYAAETAGGVTAAATALAGEVAAGTTWVFGNLAAGATLAGGTAVSAAYGAGIGLYEVASAAVVPVGHVGGAAIVLSYKSLSHLAAHSVLAVSDAAYLVLSLEGPRWVIYAVQGKLGDGSDLPEGAVVDLEAMDRNGERFYAVPVSDAEMEAVLQTMQEDLPEVPAQ